MFGTVFDLIVRSGQAYNQVGMFFGAMICLGFGGLERISAGLNRDSPTGAHG
jgi:hypothetical protein